MTTTKQILKTWFQNGKKPNQEQFWAWIEAYWHKDDKIPIDAIEELNEALGGFATTEQIEALANSDASNLSEDNIEAWKAVLGVTDLPENIGLIDLGEAQGNVFTKEQVNNLLQAINENMSLLNTAYSDLHTLLIELELNEERLGLIDSDGESDDGNVFTKDQINALLQSITTRLDSLEELDIDFSNVGSRLYIDEELNLKLLNLNGEEISSVDLSGFVVEIGINFLEKYINELQNG